MKKTTKAILHLLTGAIVSVIGFIGFKKGVETIEKEIEKKDSKKG